MSDEEKQKCREAVSRKAIDAIRSFAALDEDDLNQALLISAMLSCGNGTGQVPVSEEDMARIIKWGGEIHTRAVMLQFVLIGACEISVKDGEVCFRMRTRDETIEALVREGIAKSS